MVSVIIPNYNHEKYLQQRIESVLNQTCQDFEIILLDDHSSDNSREIIEKFRGHNKVSNIIYNKSNSGSTFHQWVRGIEAGNSEFVWIAESDDWCEPTFLENVLGGMVADSKCVVGYCQSYCIDDTNNVKWKSDHPYLTDRMEGNDFIKKFMLEGNAIFNASMAVWRRSAFLNISREFTQYRFCGDWLFWIELCRHGNVFISGKLLNYFRKHTGDVSGRAYLVGNNFLEELQMIQLLYNRTWINYEELIQCLTKEYIHYRAVSQTFDKNTNHKIQALLFAIPGTKYLLKKNYWTFYFRYLLKNFFNVVIR